MSLVHCISYVVLTCHVTFNFDGAPIAMLQILRSSPSSCLITTMQWKVQCWTRSGVIWIHTMGQKGLWTVGGGC